MSGTLSPSPWFIGLDASGGPLALGTLETLVAGTSTPAVTFQDADLTIPNENPIPLDAAGQCVIFLEPTASYKFVLRSAAGVTIRTLDGIGGVPASAAGLGVTGEVFVFGGNSSSPITGNAYPSGTAFSTLHPGTAVFNEDPNNLPGTYVLEAMGSISDGTTPDLDVALVNLSDGAPDTPLAVVELEWPGSADVVQRARSGTITFPPGGSARNFGIKAKNSVSGAVSFAYGIKLVRTA